MYKAFYEQSSDPLVAGETITKIGGDTSVTIEGLTAGTQYVVWIARCPWPTAASSDCAAVVNGTQSTRSATSPNACPTPRDAARPPPARKSVRPRANIA